MAVAVLGGFNSTLAVVVVNGFALILAGVPPATLANDGFLGLAGDVAPLDETGEVFLEEDLVLETPDVMFDDPTTAALTVLRVTKGALVGRECMLGDVLNRLPFLLGSLLILGQGVLVSAGELFMLPLFFLVFFGG